MSKIEPKLWSVNKNSIVVISLGLNRIDTSQKDEWELEQIHFLRNKSEYFDFKIKNLDLVLSVPKGEPDLQHRISFY